MCNRTYMTIKELQAHQKKCAKYLLSIKPVDTKKVNNKA